MSIPAASWETSWITLLSTFNRIGAANRTADRSEVPILYRDLLAQSKRLVSDLEKQPPENSEMLLTAARTFVAAQERLSEVTHSAREQEPNLEEKFITALKTVDIRLNELVFAKVSMPQTPKNGGASALQ